MPIIFRKTAKGAAEIETRAHRLPPRMRSTLILVDGKRDAEDLRALVTQQADELLSALLEQGFVEAVGETVRPLDAPVAAPPPPPAPVVDVTPLRKLVVRALNDELGPSAEGLAIRIEKVRTVEELRPLMSQAVQLVVAARGRAAADAFAARLPVL